MEAVKNYILSQLAAKKISAEEAKLLLKDVHEGRKEKNGRSSDIAIIGIACRYPGANNKDEYWELLASKKRMIGRFPENRRRDTDLLFSANTQEDADPYRLGGYLEEIDKFDYPIFRLSPKEAEYMDPHHRLFLETAWEAIEDSGIGNERMNGTRTGVYVGMDTSSEYKYLDVINDDYTNTLRGTGSMTSILASRIAYILNMRGPCVVLDTACSSSLIAVHSACKGILAGECDMAVAGGVSVILLPVGETGMVDSSDGVLRAFDKHANGTVWAEGAGAVLLKSVDSALRDGNSIYAVIKGSAANNDGASNGLTAPNAEAQEEVVKSAWSCAGVNPESIRYIEAHGTGTKLGDPIEIKGLTAAFREYTSKKQFCGIGSVKVNIGHTAAASGIASVVKMVLCLKNKKLLPGLGIDEPNPYINFPDSPVYVFDRMEDWIAENDARRCGVSSFGFSGTNCHVVLEEAPRASEVPEAGPKTQIYAVSARSGLQLKEYIRRYSDFLDKTKDLHLEDVCYTANTGRSHYNYRLAFLAGNTEELRDKIKQACRMSFEDVSRKIPGVFYGKHSVILNRKEKEEGDLYEEEKISLSAQANAAVDKRTVNGGMDAPAMEELCGYYVAGADIRWDALYRDSGHRTLHLPVYPLERRRCWFERAPRTNAPAVQERSLKEIEHPLLDRCILRTNDEGIYLTEFNVDRHWVLSEHLITGRNVIPGTTYLEMVMRAGTEYFGTKASRIRNVQFYEPLVVKEYENKKVYTVIRENGGKNQFSVVSHTEAEDGESRGQWKTHVTGEVYAEELEPVNRIDILMLKNYLGREIAINREETVDEGIMTFGPRWKTARTVWIGENEGLAYLELEPELLQDTGPFTLHPAILDVATSIGYIQAASKGFYLPFGYRDLAVYGPVPSRCYSRISPLLKEKDIHEIIRFNVTILDENGNVVVHIQDFAMKKVHDVKNTIATLAGQGGVYYKAGWAEEGSPVRTGVNPTGAVLVLSDGCGVSGELAEKLRLAGRTVIEAETGGGFEARDSGRYTIGGSEEDYVRLIEETKKYRICTVLHLLTLSGTLDAGNREECDAVQYKGVYSLFSLTRALIQCRVRDKMNIVLVSNLVNRVNDSEENIFPPGAALFGLGRVIPKEYEHLQCRCIDVDAQITASQIINEMESEYRSFIVAYRSGRRYVEVIDKARQNDLVKSEIEIQPRGLYVITGGTGGIGLEVAKYLTSKNRIILALINRSKMPARENWEQTLEWNEDAGLCAKIRELIVLEKSGSVVECIQADVSDYEQLQSVITGLRQRHGRVCGIIHSAGIAGDGFLIRKSEEAFRKVLAPKIQGTWNLDMLTREDKPDFFVMFSSVASIFGEPGQGDYTAANAYMDSYSEYRNRHGRRTLTINWPAWKETGMAVNYGANKDGLFKALGNAEGINYFQEALNSKIPRVIIGELNYGSILNMPPQQTIQVTDGLRADIAKRARMGRRIEGGSGPKRSVNVVVKGRSRDDYTRMENQLANLWGQTLSLSEIDIFESFYDMGGDSILAIQLSKEIEARYPGLVDIADIFSYPSVAQLAEYADKKKADAGKEKLAAGEEPADDEEDSKLLAMIKSVKSGDASLEEGLQILTERRED